MHNLFLCAADNPDAELIARIPLPDDTFEEVYKYTPDDDTLIVVDNPLDVLEQVAVSSLACCFKLIQSTEREKETERF